MNAMLGTTDFTWYLRNEEEAKAYRAAGAVHIHVSSGYPDGSPGDLVRKRNEIMEDGFALGHTVMLLSDDLYKMLKVEEDPDSPGGKGGGLRVDQWNFKDAVRYHLELMDMFPEYKMGGVSPVCNLFYCHHVVSFNLFCIGDWLIIKPNDLRMDERIKLKHDYDLTAKHIKEYGGIVRADFIFAVFEHYKPGSTGGCGTVRDLSREMQDVHYLMENHPGMFGPHPTRGAHEVKTFFKANRRSIETFKDKPHYLAYQEKHPDAMPQIMKNARTLEDKIKREKQLIDYWTARVEKTRDKLANEEAELQRAKSRLADYEARLAASGASLKTYCKCAPEQRIDFDINDPYALEYPNRKEVFSCIE